MAFVEKDISIGQQAATEMMRRTRQSGVPVIADEHEAVVGFDVRRLEAMAARQSVRPGRLGVRVKNAPGGGADVIFVHDDTIGARTGIRVGDILVAVGDRPVRDSATLEVAWNAGGARRVRVLRNGSEVDLAIG